MPAARPASRAESSFRKVRADHAREKAQDYVELISDLVHARGECRVGDLARHMGVSHVTVSRIVRRLRDEGLVEQEPYRPVRLTPAGARLAAACRRRHEVVLDMLRLIGVPEPDALRDAEGIEHHVSEATLRRMAAWIRRHRGRGA
ncbi:MAG: manganese-binding transcriptional regulator MntR [Planctomycetota bacterium]|jgi:DtxR family manganese transport transcriptional regulator